jgi:hypothetical protein
LGIAVEILGLKYGDNDRLAVTVDAQAPSWEIVKLSVAEPRLTAHWLTLLRRRVEILA